MFKLEENYLEEDNPWKGILSATAFAVRSTYHTTLKHTPGQLVFGQDMILPIKHIANWEYIHQNKQRLIDKNSKAENAERKDHTYKIATKSYCAVGPKISMKHHMLVPIAYYK